MQSQTIEAFCKEEEEEEEKKNFKIILNRRGCTVSKIEIWLGSKLINQNLIYMYCCCCCCFLFYFFVLVSSGT